MATDLSSLGYAAPLQPGQTRLPGGRVVGGNANAQASDPSSSGGYTQSPSNYYPTAQPAKSAYAASGRGPQAIPLGTPGTYQLPGGRVVPESTRAVNNAQNAYVHGAGNGQDMQSYMTSQGFGTDYFSGGQIAGVSSDGWNWNTMSSPAMDAAAGQVYITPEQARQTYASAITPDAIAAFEAEGLPPSWYVPGATSYEDVIATQAYRDARPFGGDVRYS